MHILLPPPYHTHPISSSFHYTLHILIIRFLYFETCTSSSSYTLHLQVLSICLPNPPPCTSSFPLKPYIFSSYCYTSHLFPLYLEPCTPSLDYSIYTFHLSQYLS